MGLFNTLLEMYGNIQFFRSLFLSVKPSLTTRFSGVDGIWIPAWIGARQGISFYRGLDLNFFQVTCFVHEKTILHSLYIVVVSYKLILKNTFVLIIALTTIGYF